ncbi:peptide chain release factor N(5)-glutamine methyltransferase [Gleimia sp. 6138-11-ORH1]|uniref:peptide chain release factor N(5)-glutamine methyltransferase n=1 Tax=Gleimia sp. 6138-11-ORH1 TaxID=2973937 RepID=UPI00216A34A9|nr:peptide chain release factor N(5)-glutamine methyltransferase [Gleimia sp. 6138-11-ORH1]MCS4484090.1 peptide chain release factor N(5)-glutamine methyltransferase [Gleimia sp. 6138-11-ORH1]
MESTQTQQLFLTAVQRLRAAGIESAQKDATELFQVVIQAPRYLWKETVSETERKQLEELVSRRETREPLFYILQKMWFYGLELNARPGVFCVRPETEMLVETALQWVRDKGIEFGKALDLCTGSGAIALALDSQLPNWEVTGVEVSPDALEIAKENREKLGLKTALVAADALVLRSEWENSFHLVVSNPPYVPVRKLPGETEYEPSLAFWGGGENGMEIPQQIIANAYRYLQPGGLVIMEHDDTQGEATREAASKAGFSDISTQLDLNGIDRFLIAQKPVANKS